MGYREGITTDEGQAPVNELDQAGRNLIREVRAAATDRDALRVATSAPATVLQRAADFLRIPDVDFKNEAGLSAEVAESRGKDATPARAELQ